MGNKVVLPKEVALFKLWPIRKFVHLIIMVVTKASNLWGKLRIASLCPQAVNVACHWSVEIKYPEKIDFGQGVVIGKSVTLGAKGGIKLGNHVRISKGVTIETGGLDFSTKPPYQHVSKPIEIHDGAWIGSNAIILAGVIIGERAIIGAGAVVTKNVAPGSIIVGGPNRVITR